VPPRGSRAWGLYALDRKKIRKVANFYAHETDFSATGIPPSPVNQWIKPDILAKFTKYPYDPKKAAQLFGEIATENHTSSLLLQHQIGSLALTRAKLLPNS